MIFVSAEEFELNADTGELFVNRELDREKRSLHFIIVNITQFSANTSQPSSESAPSNVSRVGRQTLNPIVECMFLNLLRVILLKENATLDTKNKLKEYQALVVVRVLDTNDNLPVFTRLTSDGIYVFTVDWQASLLQPIARVQALDADEKPTLNYSLTHTLADDHFAINATTGVISLIKSLVGRGSGGDDDEQLFNMEVAVNDGAHEARAPLKVTKFFTFK